jgi:hypothetical protein
MLNLPSTDRTPPERRVLLFEECPSLRSVAARTLRELGHEVDEAPDEDTAERLLSQRMDSYAVLVVGLDPDHRAAERIAWRAQALMPVISIVAWSTGPRPTLGQRMRWLQRSWRPDDLLRVVAQAVADAAPPPA